jgi:dephospho-CoA kinase
LFALEFVSETRNHRKMPPLHVIGLTGNIASGKSAVATILRELGAHVIDADVVAREVLSRGEPAFARTVERFGASILAKDGSIDRAALGKIVFGDPKALRDLEEITHPATRERIFHELAASTAEVAVIEAIKLLEGPLADRSDSIWVVTAPREVRLKRLQEQRGLDEVTAAARIDAQNPESEKLARADVVIVNDGTHETLRSQVLAAWRALERDIAGLNPVGTG